MKKIMAAVLVVAMSCGAASVALAVTEEQAVKEKTVAKKVKERSAKERMLPAPEVQLKRLSDGLKLTAEQRKQIRPMLKDEYAKLKEIRQDDNLSPKQIQAKVEELRTETIAKIQTVLTPEQKEVHEMISNEIKANKQKRMKENRKARLGSNAEPPPQTIKQ
jgi:NAD(P)H-hydrate repair Nnr-like enzyme with NAD(P)H-hydrate dehydratase domain